MNYTKDESLLSIFVEKQIERVKNATRSKQIGVNRVSRKQIREQSMKQRSNMNDKKFLHIIRLVLTLIIIGGVSSSLYAKNEDTPNLDFSKGTWEGWTRYYGYYGPVNLASPAIGNTISNNIKQDIVESYDI